MKAEYEEIRESVPPLLITSIANGFMVQGAPSFQRNCEPSNAPAQWYAFESFDALVKHLRLHFMPSERVQR